MKKIVDYLIHNSTLGNLITVSVIIAGIVTLGSMRREAFPNIDFDIVVVTVAYPGASPQEVEKLIILPLEREVKSVDGIKKSSSTSLDSRASLVLTLDPDVENKMKVVQDIRDAVDRAKVDFPEDAEEPVVLELSTSRTPVIELALSFQGGFTKKHNELALRKYAKQLQDKLELLPDAAAVTRRGYREREIFVEIFPDKLKKYNVSSDEIVQALQQRNLNFPGGTITHKGKEYIIRTVMEYANPEEIRNTVIRANDFGGALKIKDVAYVRSDFEKKNIKEKALGEEAIILTVLKKETGDAIRLVDQVRDEIDLYKKTAPGYLEITPINDISYYIRRRLNVLTWNVVIGMGFVILSLLFFMGWRISLMVALGIPFSFAITFLAMGNMGMSINLISMFGLIIVSGMLVDDAIVIGENIYRYIEQGMKPRKAAVRGTMEMIGPVFASVSTTMVAFAPLLYMSGIIGKFIWSLPAAVIIALAASLFESFFILPSHVADITGGLSKENIVKKETSLEAKLFRWMQRVYEPILYFAVKRRYLLMYIVG
ncbi:MAG: efflux RND transporter permease subunit, partial [Candidatus Hydrogenedentota bacterium]